VALVTDLQVLARHFVDKLEAAKASITHGGTQAFTICDYGEPKVITQWPYCSVQPIEKLREVKGTRKYELIFRLYVVIYHGTIAEHLGRQEDTHKKAEAVETWLQASRKWNYVDEDDADEDRVIHGHVASLDHPVVVAPKEELWAASRLLLVGVSEEVF